MAKKRPTESSWDSDEDFLLEDTSSVSAFSKKPIEEEIIDEDALLGIGREDNSLLQDKSGAENYEILLDDSGAAAFDITADSQELDYEDTYQEEEIGGIDDALVVDERPNNTTADIQTIKSEVFGAKQNESDSDSEEEKKGRDRFKTERQTISLKSAFKAAPDIPDSLEVTKEMQEEIDTFEKKKGNRRQPFNKHGRNQQQQQQQHQQQQYQQQNNQGQFRHPHPRGNRPQGFNNRQRGPNSNFGPRGHQRSQGQFQGPRNGGQIRPNGPQHRFGGPNHGQGLLQGQRGPGPFPQLMNQGASHPHPGQNQSPQFHPPQQSSPIPVTGPGQPLPAPHQFPGGEQPPFNPNASQPQAPHAIHVNPKFQGSLPADIQQQQPGGPPQHHHQQHSVPPQSVQQPSYSQPQPVQNHFQSPQMNWESQPPHSSPVPVSYQHHHQQQPGIMQPPRPHLEPPHLGQMNNPQPGLLDSPRPPGMMQPHGQIRPRMEPPRPLMQIPPRPLMEPARPFMGTPRPGRFEGPRQTHQPRNPMNHQAGQQPQHMYPPNSMGHGPRPQGHQQGPQFMGNLPGPHGHTAGMGSRPQRPLHGNLPQRPAGPQGPNQQVRPLMMQRAPRPEFTPRGRPQRFQNPHNGSRQQVPQQQHPRGYNPNAQDLQLQNKTANTPVQQNPELLEKQRIQAETLKKRMERFSDNTTVTPSTASPSNLKVLTGIKPTKRPSTETYESSPPKALKTDLKTLTEMTRVVKTELKKEEPMDVDAKLHAALEEQKRQRELVQKIKEAKRMADANKRRKQLSEKLAAQGQSMADLNVDEAGAEIQQNQEKVYKQQQQPAQHQGQGQFTRQLSQNSGQPSQQGKFNQQRGNQRGGNRGRGINKQHSQMQGQPISVLGQLPQVQVQQGHGRGQMRGHGHSSGNQNRGRGGGQSRGRGNVRGNGRGLGGKNWQNIGQLQQVNIQENTDIEEVTTPPSNRTVMPVKQKSQGAKHTNTGLNGKGAASQVGKEPERTVIAHNPAETGNPNTGRTVVANTSAQRRIVLNSSGGPERSCVSIEGLSANADLGKINKFCSSMGEIKVFNYKAEERRVLVKFGDPAGAAKFIKKYNRFMLDLTLISSKLIPDF